MICAPATSSGPSAGTSAGGSARPRRAPDRLEHREVEARLLRERARGDVAVGAERALGGQQRQPALGDGRPQLLDPDAVRVQRLQQREPRRARVPVEAVEQPERGEVRPGHAGTAAATGATATGMPLSTALPLTRVEQPLVGEHVRVDARRARPPRRAARRARRGPSRAGARRRRA